MRGRAAHPGYCQRGHAGEIVRHVINLGRFATRTRLGQIGGQFCLHLRQCLVDHPHLRPVAQVEQAPHRVLGHTELLCQLELGPASRAHRLVDGELCGDERGQNGAVGPLWAAPCRGSGLPAFM